MATSSLFGDINFTTTPLTSPWVDSSLTKKKTGGIVKGASTERTAPVSSGVSSGSSAKATSSKEAKAFDLEKETQKKKEAEAKRLEAQKEEARKGISSSFEPIFAELDRQLGNLPTVKTQYASEIGRLGSEQATTAEAERQRGIAQLESSKGEIEKNTQASLRALEDDIRNQLKAKASYFGNVGAGDSSAVNAASEAVTRAGLKSRASVLSERDQALSEIEQKKSDVNSLASDQINKIESWKSEKLFQIEQDFNEKSDALNKEKAAASSEEKRAISELINGLNQQFNSRLQQLDDAVTSYKTQIATWEMQRTADLEDYAKKLSMSASYSGSDSVSKSQKAANDLFNQSLAQGFDADTARQRTLSQTGIDPLSGLELTAEQKKSLGAGDNFITTDYTGKPAYIVNKKTGQSTAISQEEAPVEASAKSPGITDYLTGLFK